MPKSSNSAKTKWNAANYTQIKAYINPELASKFKSICKAAGVSVNSVLTQFIANHCAEQTHKKVTADPLSTKKKRRNKLHHLIDELKQIRDTQQNANDNVPDNFRDSEAFEVSEESVEKLDEAIEILEGIY